MNLCGMAIWWRLSCKQLPHQIHTY